MRADPVALILVLEGLIFMLTVWVTRVWPPKKINMLYGYRTKRSMKSVENWEFAQAYSRRAMFRGGMAMVAFGVILYPVYEFRHIAVDVVLILAATIGVCWWLFRSTEKALVSFENSD